MTKPKRQLTIKKRCSLAFLGEGWEEAFAHFKPLEAPALEKITKYETSQEDIKADPSKAMPIIKDMLDLIKSHFIDGKGVVDGEFTDLEAGDLELMPPAEIINAALDAMVGKMAPAFLGPSGPQSLTTPPPTTPPQPTT